MVLVTLTLRCVPQAMGVDRVVAVDLHCGQIQGFFGPRVPVDNLDGGTVGVSYFGDKDLHNPGGCQGGDKGVGRTRLGQREKGVCLVPGKGGAWLRSRPTSSLVVCHHRRDEKRYCMCQAAESRVLLPTDCSDRVPGRGRCVPRQEVPGRPGAEVRRGRRPGHDHQAEVRFGPAFDRVAYRSLLGRVRGEVASRILGAWHAKGRAAYHCYRHGWASVPGPAVSPRGGDVLCVRREEGQSLTQPCHRVAVTCLMFGGGRGGGSVTCPALWPPGNDMLCVCVRRGGRARANEVDRMDLVGSVADSDCVIVDDMIDTAGTLGKAADVLVANGGELLSPLGPTGS
jgi:phosphoribosylpyrophosphate synthetase